MSNRQGVTYDADTLVNLTPGSLTYNGATYDVTASGSAAAAQATASAALAAAAAAQATANAALPKAGGTMTGQIDMSNQKIVSLGTPTVSTDAATKGYVDTSVVGLLDLQGTIDCSTNPNYPAANKGDVWVVSVAGLIGGGAGISVQAGDALMALADNPGGTQAAVGSSWSILQANLVGALLAVNNLSDVQNVATARTNLGLGTAATYAATAFAQTANNLSDLTNAATARTNLGLGTAATQNSTAFATAAQGTLASTAVQRAGDTMTGTLNFQIPGSNLGIRLKDNADLTRYMDIFCGSQVFGFFGYGNQDMWFGANGTTMVRILPNGNIGFGLTGQPLYRIHNAIAYAKTDTTQRQAWFMSTNEVGANSPFGALFSITGAASLANRIYDVSTTDYNVAWGGNFVLQRYGGKVGIGTGNTVPTALMLLGAGTASANTAPLKFASGTYNTTPEAGAFEYNGTLSFTDSSAARKDVALKTTYTPTLTPALIVGTGYTEQTFTVTGLATTDTVTVNGPAAAANSVLVHWRVSAANTLALTWITDAANITPTSGTYRIVAIRS